MTLATESPPTTTTIPAAVTPFVPSPESLKRFTIAEYHRLVAAGAFEGQRIELLDGWIIKQMTHNPLHDVTVDRVQEAIRDRVSRDWRVRVQSAITLSASEPEPDVAVAIGPAARYVARHPGPADLALVVEVADSSLDTDRRDKGLVYALEGIAVYWIVNVPARAIEVYTLTPSPAGGRTYGQPTRYAAGSAVPLSVGGQALPPISVDDVLP